MQSAPIRKTIFISLSKNPDDDKWFRRLETHLKPYLRKNSLQIWANPIAQPGANLEQERSRAIDKTAIAIALVSAEYLASDDLIEKELPLLEVARKAKKFDLHWILLGPCAYEESPFSATKPLHPLDHPLRSLPDEEQDRTLKHIAKSIADIALPPPQVKTDPSLGTLPSTPSPAPAPEKKEAPPIEPTPNESADFALMRRRAHAVVGGHLVQFAIQPNTVSGRRIALALRSNRIEDYAKTMHVLEEIGHTFRRIWSSEDLHAPELLEFADIDGDGAPELVFKAYLGGNAYWYERLSIYFPSRRLLIHLSEEGGFTPTSPVARQVSIEPEHLDHSLLSLLEQIALRYGFLKGRDDFDLDSPHYAAQRWHIDNGDIEEGTICERWFQGSPQYGSSEVASLTAGGFEWTGFFKGALYAYEATQDRFFVVFSPVSSYDWTTNMAFGRGILWFTSHFDDGFRSFEMATRRLRKHKLKDGGFAVDSMDISSDGEWLIFNKGSAAHRVRISDLLH